MPRNSFCQISVLTDLKGRKDYISNPDRQEYLYQTYNTADDPHYWKELVSQNRREYEKYECSRKCVEAREWIIALEESLVKEDPENVLYTFVDAFKETYHVECYAGLHHNKRNPIIISISSFQKDHC